MSNDTAKAAAKAQRTAATKKEAPQDAAAQTRKRVPEVPRSAFNFIAENWEQRRRRRRSLATVGGVVGVTMSLVLGYGYKVGNEMTALSSKQAKTQQEIEKTHADVAAVFGPGGADVVQHMKERVGQIDGILAYDIDGKLIEEQLLQAIDPNLQLRSIQIVMDPQAIVVPGTTVPPTEGETTTTSTTITANTSSPQTTVPSTLQVGYLINFEVVGSDYSDAPNLKVALSQVSFLTGVNLVPNYTGGSGVIINVSARLNVANVQTRRAAAAQQLEGF